MLRVDSTFKLYDDAMVFCEFIFIVLFRTDGSKGHLSANKFCHSYADCFVSAIMYITWSGSCLKFVISSCEAYW